MKKFLWPGQFLRDVIAPRDPEHREALDLFAIEIIFALVMVLSVTLLVRLS
ncbi:MAG: hypothetical protein K2Q10_00230 [Rhodospirillales bacterium]|nr:hypothetical protein [Rhodospirillales bacterium]